jgi:radical SAM superfamily enzyme YgiQ (UPF0313 family)
MTNSPGTEVEPIRSHENNMFLKDFDILAFSIQYELDYPHVLWILENSSIPIYSKVRMKSRIDQNQEERENNDPKNYPLIIAGGPCIRANPLIFSQIIDAGFIGEFEPAIDLFFDAWNNIKSQDQSYDQIQLNFMLNLLKIPGFWIPAKNFYLTGNQNGIQNGNQNTHSIPQITRIHVKSLDEVAHPTKQLIPTFPTNQENPLPFGKTIFLEINRGCPHGCRFCLTGHQLKPFRNRSLNQLKSLILTVIKETKLRNFTLIGASVTDYPQFKELCQFFIEQNISFILPSIRIDTITADLVKMIVQGGMKTVAIAPETGSNQLRYRMNKSISNDQILNGTKCLFENGIQNLKMYFLYGLPFETDTDLHAIEELIRAIGEQGWGKDSLRLSLNPFIPKPHTPFEVSVALYQSPSLEELKRRYRLITSNLKGNRQVKIETLPLEEAYLQTIFALANESFDEILKKCYQNGLNPHKWFIQIKNKELSHVNEYFSSLIQSKFGTRPWNIISQGLPDKFLEQDFLCAMGNKTRIPKK